MFFSFHIIQLAFFYVNFKQLSSVSNPRKDFYIHKNTVIKNKLIVITCFRGSESIRKLLAVRTEIEA